MKRKASSPAIDPAQLFDQLQAEEKLLSKHRRKVKRLREQLEESFRGKPVVKTPARAFLRVVALREYSPLPAKTAAFVSYHEIPLDDL